MFNAEPHSTSRLQEQIDESGETASMNKSAQDSGCHPLLELYIGPDEVETEDVMNQPLLEINND